MASIGRIQLAAMVLVLIVLIGISAGQPDFTNQGYVYGYGTGYYNDIYWLWPQWISWWWF